MNKLITFSLALCAFNGFGQSYEPPAGTAGTSAMYKDSSAFTGWATGIELKRGYLNAADTNFAINGNNKATFGSPNEALNKAEGSSMTVVSLGDGGVATLTFAQPIHDGEGPDFAVFENSFLPDFLELAFVEVSSDGIHFFRFPAHTEVPSTVQVDTYGTMDCRYVHNLAGKYEQGYGTPFDLSELPVDALLNTGAITHVRIIDVIGSVDPEIATYDSFGNMVNDPFPTAFASGGFDLDAVGVIHQGILGIDEHELQVQIYPNPVSGILHVRPQSTGDLRILDLTGKLLLSKENIQHEMIDMQQFGSGIYLVEVSAGNARSVQRVVVR